jgi:hypothetical protein
MNPMPYPQSSPDIAPREFFLFGYRKEKLRGGCYDIAMNVFTAIADLMENLEKSLLHRAFNEWISRLHHVVESAGEYIQPWQKNFATQSVA